MKKFAVLLSGCGHQDGTEITEAVSTIIALSELGATSRFFAPRVEFESQDHLTGLGSGRRSTLAESARIARGQVEDLSDLRVTDFDGLVIPGGRGAVSVLCTFAADGARARVLPEVRKVIESFSNEEKPIGAFCIAPALVACVLGSKGVTVTIGHDSETITEIEKTGAHHSVCKVTDYISDRDCKVVTSPAYMLEAQPFEIFTGIRRAVRELVEMA